MNKEFCEAPRKLIEVGLAFETLVQGLGKTALCTRVREKIEGSSGVHEAGRGLDFRDEFVNDHGVKVCLFTPEEAEYIVATLNSEYPRKDGHVTALHHSFRGAPYHFHLQIPVSDLTLDEQKRNSLA